LISSLVRPVSANIGPVVNAATARCEPTVTVAVPPEWTRSSETASIREVDDLQDRPDHQLISTYITDYRAHESQLGSDRLDGI